MAAFLCSGILTNCNGKCTSITGYLVTLIEKSAWMKMVYFLIRCELISINLKNGGFCALLECYMPEHRSGSINVKMVSYAHIISKHNYKNKTSAHLGCPWYLYTCPRAFWQVVGLANRREWHRNGDEFFRWGLSKMQSPSLSSNILCILQHLNSNTLCYNKELHSFSLINKYKHLSWTAQALVCLPVTWLIVCKGVITWRISARVPKEILLKWKGRLHGEGFCPGWKAEK